MPPVSVKTPARSVSPAHVQKTRPSPAVLATPAAEPVLAVQRAVISPAGETLLTNELGAWRCSRDMIEGTRSNHCMMPLHSGEASGLARSGFTRRWGVRCGCRRTTLAEEVVGRITPPASLALRRATRRMTRAGRSRRITFASGLALQEPHTCRAAASVSDLSKGAATLAGPVAFEL